MEFILGTGINKCLLICSQLKGSDKNIYIKNLCINALNRSLHIECPKILTLNCKVLTYRTTVIKSSEYSIDNLSAERTRANHYPTKDSLFSAV